jgi:hypothetical protein
MSHTKCPECNLIFTPKNHEDEIKTLRAENARFRDALEDIVHCIYSNEATLNYCEKKAREALKGE